MNSKKLLGEVFSPDIKKANKIEDSGFRIGHKYKCITCSYKDITMKEIGFEEKIITIDFNVAEDIFDFDHPISEKYSRDADECSECGQISYALTDDINQCRNPECGFVISK